MPLMTAEMVDSILGPGWARRGIQMPYHHDSFYDMLLREPPWPHLVCYRAGRVSYVPPDKIRMHTETKSPSDCTWIVPGTGQ